MEKGLHEVVEIGFIQFIERFSERFSVFRVILLGAIPLLILARKSVGLFRSQTGSMTVRSDKMCGSALQDYHIGLGETIEHDPIRAE